MKIYIMRHGQDDEGYRGGWSQRGLIEEGLLQARTAAGYIYNNRELLNIGRIISSDLKRAFQTAKEVGDCLGIPIELSPDWREMNNGELAGMANDEAEKKYPGLYASTLMLDQKYPGGESPSEFYERIKQSFEKLCKDLNWEDESKNILLVTHGGVINVIYHIINGIPWTNSVNAFHAGCTSIHCLQYSLGKWETLLSNFMGHLDIE